MIQEPGFSEKPGLRQAVLPSYALALGLAILASAQDAKKMRVLARRNKDPRSLG